MKPKINLISFVLFVLCLTLSLSGLSYSAVESPERLMQRIIMQERSLLEVQQT